ncbi:hypothetical protein SAMN04489713_103565 [Actinomadura madurae]|uniref:Lipoprotein LpqN n=1 Tax=Actinomadura madurae TaxID=1993 RepID=A0A1I5DB55_9ACTN|nr:hypothetical protein [Actinomadura madurae]SFN96422.1 hypothetical protein SAMN04489713_103565 [Actinomadura madurae]
MGAKRLTIMAATAALAVAAGAAACSSGGSGKTPEGSVRGDAKVLSVAYPKDWQRGPESDIALSMQAPGQAAFLSVIKDVSDRGRQEMLQSTIEAGPMMNAKGYRRTEAKEIKVAGAKGALRVDYTFNDFRGAAGTPGEGVDVGVIGANGHVHTIRLVWQRGKLDDEVVDGVVDSIKVR